ncbi:MAG TPA: hypothetical protein VGN63_18880 [Flavisolibacter sp.]|jgi:hypothetical protein|nr:hypothetical protein [Flavisolibacter sp.]
MKTITIAFLLLLSGERTRAQTWDEWFRQKETQIRYLTEQLAALKMYGSTVTKGYTILKEGLHTISGYKEADVAQHRERFQSLGVVNETVKNGGFMKEITALRGRMVTIYEKNRRFVQTCRQYTPDEIRYVRSVLEGVVKRANGAWDDAALVVSDEGIQLTDDERIRRLQKLGRRMLDLYAFAASFDREIATLAVAREGLKREGQRIRSFY